MGYYIRLLAIEEGNVPLSTLRDEIAPQHPPAVIEVDPDTSDKDWTEFVLKHRSGVAIAMIQRNPVAPGELGKAEIDEFIASLASCRPVSAARWLAAYLPQVKSIFSFQILSGSEESGGWEAVYAVRGALQDRLGGITQADGEGFSNVDGYHILWQFSDDVSGDWSMAVLDDDGNWIRFRMDLGNRRHRTAFRRGEVPEGAELLD